MKAASTLSPSILESPTLSYFQEGGGHQGHHPHQAPDLVQITEPCLFLRMEQRRRNQVPGDTVGTWIQLRLKSITAHHFSSEGQ